MRARSVAPFLIVIGGCSLLVDTSDLDEGPPEAPEVDASTSDAPRPPTGDDAATDAPSTTPDDAGADSEPELPRIVGDWPFDDGAGTTLSDVSGRGHHGLIFGTGAWGADRTGDAGRAYEFLKSTDYVSVPASADFDRPAGATFSMAAWMRTEQASNHDMFFAVRLGNDNAFGLELLTATELTYYDGRDHVATSVVPNTVGPWHHYALVVDGDRARLYFDGIRVGQGRADASARKGGALVFAGYNDGERLVGAIDQARFFRVALTDAEVLAEKNR